MSPVICYVKLDSKKIGQFIQKNPTRCKNVSKFVISIFIWSSTCFGRHTAHHREPKTALVASGFAYVEGCWTCGCWTLSFHACKTRGCQCSFRLLMTGGVSPETCWALYKYGIINFDILLHLVGFFLYELYYDARFHEHQNRSVFAHFSGQNTSKNMKCHNTAMLSVNAVKMSRFNDTQHFVCTTCYLLPGFLPY